MIGKWEKSLNTCLKYNLENNEGKKFLTGFEAEGAPAQLFLQNFQLFSDEPVQ